MPRAHTKTQYAIALKRRGTRDGGHLLLEATKISLDESCSETIIVHTDRSDETPGHSAASNRVTPDLALFPLSPTRSQQPDSPLSSSISPGLSTFEVAMPHFDMVPLSGETREFELERVHPNLLPYKQACEEPISAKPLSPASKLGNPKSPKAATKPNSAKKQRPDRSRRLRDWELSVICA